MTAWRRTGRWLRRTGSVLAVLLILSVATGVTPAQAQLFSCKESPEPDRPGSGLVGTIDPPRPDGGAEGSVYREVGYAGLVWHTYDLGCFGQVAESGATVDTFLGNQMFNGAKVIVAATNYTHHLIVDGGAVLDPLDGIIVAGTTAMYEVIFTSFVGIALLGLAVVLIWWAARGELSRQATRISVAVLALTLGSAAYLAPIDWAHLADDLLLDGVTDMQTGFLEPLGLGNRDTLPTVLVDQVVYQNWLRGEYGDPTAPQAVADGRELLRAQTFTIPETAEGRATPELAEQKKTAFGEIADRAGDRRPFVQGKTGSRAGAGVLALLTAGAVGVFQLAAKLLVLAALLVLRLLVMCAPAVAVVAMLRPQVLPGLLRLAGTAVVNTLVVGALAGLHALVIVTLLRPESGVPLVLALIVSAVVTTVLWSVAQPFRRMRTMIEMTRAQVPGGGRTDGEGAVARAWARLRTAPAGAGERQTRWWVERARSGSPARPESRSAAAPSSPPLTGSGAVEPARAPVVVEGSVAPRQLPAGGSGGDR
jgi:hypothetical protein